jgi:hypothetical protein
MKKPLLLSIVAFSLTLYSCKVTGQLRSDKKITSEKEKLYNSRLFFALIDSLQSLHYDIDQTDNGVRKAISLKKNWSFKVDNFLVSSYSATPVNTQETFFSSGIFIVKRGKKNFLVSGSFAYTTFNSQGGETADSTFHKMLAENNVFVDTIMNHYERSDSSYQFGFIALEKNEKDYFFQIIKEESLRRLLLWDYSGTFALEELLDPNYDFDVDREYKNKHIYDHPYLSVIKRLYENQRFEEMKKLLNTKNRFFNWFVSEALFFYNKQNFFLDSKTLVSVEKYNGKNGFPKFRSNSALSNLYL